MTSASPLTLRDVFTIPEQSGTDDYVLRLSSSVESDRIEQTLRDYVVTPELARAFDQALGLVSEAQRSGENKAAFLEGSFGSGKSHFMAVLHAVLAGNPSARNRPDLQPVIGRHPDLDGVNILRLTFHFLDSDNIEATLFTQYLDQIAALHPDRPAPVLHSAGALFEDAEHLRAQLGDEQFLAGLPQQSGGNTGLFSQLGVASTAWTLPRYQAALAPGAPLHDRQELQRALTHQHFRSYSRNSNWLSLDDGLAEISRHAGGLGYQGIVLLLDELILWLTFIITESARLNREVQKITKLVEGSHGRLAIPVTSFVARQHDLRRWLDNADGFGADQDAFERALQHQSGRFSTIRLGDENLPYIAHQRLLQPKSESAALALNAAFERVDRTPAVWDVLRNGLNLDDDQRAADSKAFRLTYPFSPALIDTLKSLAGVMQRERTALKVMQKMLITHADTLTIDHVIPVGEAFDDLVEGTSTSSDPRVGEKFDQAKTLWRTKLRPYILSKQQFSVDVDDHALPPSVQGELRLAKTAVLASLAPNVPALRSVDTARLAALNHGSIKEILPGTAPGTALQSVRSWTAAVPEVKLGEGTTPLVTVTLADVDYQSIIERARNEDNPGRRRDLFKEMLFADLQLAGASEQIGGVHTERIVWRGTHREVDWLFGNVRDRTHLPDDAFRARPGTVRMILDYPFDVESGTSADDHERLHRWKMDHGADHLTIVWLPMFLTDEETAQLGLLVKLNAVLKGDNWRKYSDDLATQQRPVARNILETQRNSLRGQFSAWIQQVYGAAAGRVFRDSEPPLVSLTDVLAVGKPVGANLLEAAHRLAAELFDAAYPEHPEFTPPEEAITDGQLGKVLGLLRDAYTRPDQRLPLERADRDLVRRIVAPLALAKVNETHLIFTATEFQVWNTRIGQGLSAQGVSPDGPVQVEVLRSAVNPPSTARGLTDSVRDLLVCAWAMQHQRSWWRSGSAVNEPGSLREIHAEQELRPQTLPDRDLFATAVARYQAWLGGTHANTHLSSATVATFVQAAQQTFREATNHQQHLVESLERASTALSVDEGPRLALARALNADGATLQRSGQEVAFVETLGSLTPPAGDEEIAASYHTASDVRRALDGSNWNRYGIVISSAADGDVVAADILSDVRAALQASQFARPLESALKANEERRQDWLEKRPTPGPTPPPGPVTPPPPGPTPSPGPDVRVRVMSAPGVDPAVAQAVQTAVEGILASLRSSALDVQISLDRLDKP